MNGNYYCLLDDGVMEAQADLAKKYGVYGFCYYHYWFAHGKKLLEKPIERMLKNPGIDIPFCLCWANENWTRLWDGGNHEVIVTQDYDDKGNLDRHIDYLCEFFADPRYIQHDGKPFFIVYRSTIIPNINERIQYIRERVKSNGFPGIFIAAQHPTFFDIGKHKSVDMPIDAYIYYQPLFSAYTFPSAKNRLKAVLSNLYLLDAARELKQMLVNSFGKKLEVLDYDTVWEHILAETHNDPRFIAGAFTDWDNTPRRKTGRLFKGASPEKFRAYMTRLVQKVREEYSLPYIFINAWNEWGEGAYLEPDERYGYAYLEALRDSLTLQ